jgi:hypothetical protein
MVLEVGRRPGSIFRSVVPKHTTRPSVVPKHTTRPSVVPKHTTRPSVVPKHTTRSKSLYLSLLNQYAGDDHCHTRDRRGFQALLGTRP